MMRPSETVAAWACHGCGNAAKDFITSVALGQNWNVKVYKHSNDIKPCELEKKEFVSPDGQ